MATGFRSPVAYGALRTEAGGRALTPLAGTQPGAGPLHDHMEQNIGKCGSNIAMCASEPAARALLALGDTFGQYPIAADRRAPVYLSDTRPHRGEVA